jgi:hypothetical protein
MASGSETAREQSDEWSDGIEDAKSEKLAHFQVG